MIAELDPEIAATIERADQFLADPKVRYYLEARHKAVTTQATLVATSFRKGIAEGIEKGRVEGRAEGHAEGRAEGRAEGIEEGSARKTVKLAKSSLLKRFGQLNPAIIRRFDEMFENLPNEAECDRIFGLALKCASLEEFEASF